MCSPSYYQKDNKYTTKEEKLYLQIDNKLDIICYLICYIYIAMNLNDYLGSLPRGASASMARKIGVKLPIFSAWRHGTRKIPIKHCFQIEQLTGGQVSRKDLRPDDWFLIWPELSD